MDETAAGEVVTPRNVFAVAAAYSRVRALADAGASLPLQVFRRTDAGRQRVTGGLADLLDRPAPTVTGANLVAQTMAHLNLHGEAFVGLFSNPAGDVEQLVLLPPDRVTVELKAGLPLFTYTDGSGQPRTLSERDVLHVRGLSVDGVRGLSPVAACRESLGTTRAAERSAAHGLANAAAPAGVLSVSGSPAEVDELMGNLDRRWAERHGGAENRGGSPWWPPRPSRSRRSG